MPGTMIEFEGNGTPFSGYLSPSKNGMGPGVIVIQEWWGLVGHIKNVCDRFAEEGFTALAPDFYHGKETKEPDEASSLMMALEIDDASKVIHGAIGALLANPATIGEKVAVVGFCMGGQLALYAACIDDRIAACVDYYGIHPNVHPKIKDLHCPLLGFFAERDEYVYAAMVSLHDLELAEAGKVHKFHTYEGAHHAFFNDDRPEVYDKAAAEDSWQQMTKFFHRQLG